jgi:Asp-tRNA(Asn)/Glu-tRNA(Gln) amidotransferase A subunit family amidase
MTIEEAAAALRDGTLTSVELTRSVLEQADRHDGWLGVYLARFDETALQRAAQADEEFAAGTDLGPLHGIPVGVKDILAAWEGPTTAQSLVLDPAWGAGRDAAVVSRLRDAGAVIVGKTTTMEFAMGLPEAEKGFPVPVGPWRAEHWCGGSSSGSGSGVAAGFFLAAIGTDTAGSIRIPSAFCGVTGLMPTAGTVPAEGCVPLAHTLDRIGPLAGSAWDCGAVQEAIGGGSLRDGIDGGIDGLRIGVVREQLLDGAEPDVVDVYEAAVATLAELGADLTEVSLPLYSELGAATMTTLWSESFAYHRDDLASRWTDYTTTARLMMTAGAFVTGAEYAQAQKVRAVGRRRLGELLEGVDVIVTPTVSMTPPLMRTAFDPGHWLRLHTMYWNSVPHPLLALPIGFVDGLPLGMQLAAAPHADATLLRAGRAFQRHTDWHRRTPDLEAARG